MLNEPSNRMLTLSRHLLAILLMPFIVVVVIPNWLSKTVAHGDTYLDMGLLSIWLPKVLGMIFILTGLILFIWCVGLFARLGRGTLAPWDPTQTLVAVGPYRHVRNPMISGVALMLVGQAVFRGSWVLGLWSCFFILVNHIYFVLSEEPGLERRFGEQYRLYKQNVPRWIPHIKPWQGS
ncbi:MAG: isoprenylcysteine carboxylmethyltransferase family protein [Chloroflexota bacterium]